MWKSGAFCRGARRTRRIHHLSCSYSGLGDSLQRRQGSLTRCSPCRGPDSPTTVRVTEAGPPRWPEWRCWTRTPGATLFDSTPVQESCTMRAKRHRLRWWPRSENQLRFHWLSVEHTLLELLPCCSSHAFSRQGPPRQQGSTGTVSGLTQGRGQRNHRSIR